MAAKKFIKGLSEADSKRFTDISKFRVKCKCGHTIIMSKAERTVCSHCGHYIYKTPAIEFRYKMKEKLKNGRILSNNN